MVSISDMVPFKQVMSKVIEVNKGDACVLELPPMDSYPAPIMNWFEQSTRIGSAEKGKRHISLNNELVILEAVKEDGRDFSVTATNVYMTGDRSRTSYRFSVSVNGKLTEC